MSAHSNFWFGTSDTMYIDGPALVVRRHRSVFPGRYEIAYCGGTEAADALGLEITWWPAVVDDFGNLVVARS